MTDEERRKRYEIITESWKLMNAAMKNLPSTDEEIQKFISDSEKLNEKFGHTQFGIEILTAVVSEIDRIITKKEENK
jgi:hypothetical protein